MDTGNKGHAQKLSPHRDMQVGAKVLLPPAHTEHSKRNADTKSPQVRAMKQVGNFSEQSEVTQSDGEALNGHKDLVIDKEVRKEQQERSTAEFLVEAGVRDLSGLTCPKPRESVSGSKGSKEGLGAGEELVQRVVEAGSTASGSSFLKEKLANELAKEFSTLILSNTKDVEMKCEEPRSFTEEVAADFKTEIRPCIPVTPLKKANPILNGREVESEAKIKAATNAESSEEAKKAEIWKLPMSQWPKPKALQKAEPVLAHTKPQVKTPLKKFQLPKEPAKTPFKFAVTTSGLHSPHNFPKKPLTKKGTLYKFMTGHATKGRDGKQGEDAEFACERGLGVADGVGGWSAFGVDSAAFSLKLMQECERELRRAAGLPKESGAVLKKCRIPKAESYVGLDFQENTLYTAKEAEEGWSESARCSKRSFEQEVDPVAVLSKAYARTEAVGSSTASVAVLNGSTVEVANLGDSTFLHLSLQDKQYVVGNVSREQQHEFNVPYQLARLPNTAHLVEMKLGGRIKEAARLERMLAGGKICRDAPESSNRYGFEVRRGDVVVLGTDGLFDNLSVDEVRKIVNECMASVRTITPRVAKVLLASEE